MSLPETLTITKDVQQLKTGSLILDFYVDESNLFLFWEHEEEERRSFQISTNITFDSSRKWKRWVVGDMTQLYITPRLPELPLVVKPSSELHIQSGAKVTLYVEIPLTLVCRGSEKSSDTLVEIHTEKLKKTWFGEPTSGELCYFLKTGINTEHSEMSRYEHHAIAPVTIVNDANEQLNVKRLSLDMNVFNLYRGGDGYWTDHQQVKFKGSVSESQIRNLGKPLVDSELQLVAAGRKKFKDIVRKSFDTFLFPRGF